MEYANRLLNGENALRVYRDLRGITHAALAEKADVKRVTVAETHICRWRVCRTQTSRRVQGARPMDRSDRQTTQHRGRVLGLPRRRVVERAFALLNRCRRLSKDWEKSIASAEAWILIAHIRRVTRHLAML